jgi:hypothetical protein
LRSYPISGAALLVGSRSPPGYRDRFKQSLTLLARQVESIVVDVNCRTDCLFAGNRRLERFRSPLAHPRKFANLLLAAH